MSQTRPGIKKYKQSLYLPLKQSISKIYSNNFRYLQMISVGPVDFVCEFYESFSLQVTRDGLEFCNSGFQIQNFRFPGYSGILESWIPNPEFQNSKNILEFGDSGILEF